MCSILNTYKDMLTHSLQFMRYNFTYLDLGFTQTATPLLNLEKLRMAIDQFSLTLEALPLSCEGLDRVTQDDIRTELSIISTRAQLLRIKNAGELGGNASLYIRNILKACELIIQGLETTKASTAEIS